MPRQQTTRSTRPATSTREASTRATPTRKANGGNGGNSRGKAGFWPVELGLSTEVDLVVEGQNGDSLGLGICSLCAALVPGSEVSQQLHRNWHDTIAQIAGRTTR